jgi:hypothetical protein
MNPMKACPRYDTCTAPICPLDPDWHHRSHLPGERVCVWLTELSKPRGEERIRSVLTWPTADQVVQSRIREHGGANLRCALDRASRTGSKLEKNRRFGEAARARRLNIPPISDPSADPGVMVEARKPPGTKKGLFRCTPPQGPTNSPVTAESG